MLPAMQLFRAHCALDTWTRAQPVVTHFYQQARSCSVHDDLRSTSRQPVMHVGREGLTAGTPAWQGLGGAAPCGSVMPQTTTVQQSPLLQQRLLVGWCC